MSEPETFEIPSSAALALSDLVQLRLESLRVYRDELSPRSKLRRADAEYEIATLLPIADACRAEVARQLAQDSL